MLRKVKEERGRTNSIDPRVFVNHAAHISLQRMQAPRSRRTKVDIFERYLEASFAMGSGQSGKLWGLCSATRASMYMYGRHSAQGSERCATPRKTLAPREGTRSEDAIPLRARLRDVAQDFSAPPASHSRNLARHCTRALRNADR
jgi:hypothetical protein